MMMMMIGDVPRSNPPTLHIPRIPTWRDNSHNTYSCLNNYAEDPLITAAHIIHSPSTTTTSTSQCLYYDSGDNDVEEYSSSSDDNNYDVAMDAFSSDEFRMYEFKVKRCARGRSHDWTECPFAHPREKARRRDPRKYHYSGTACPDFRKGACRRGDACEHAHGVFECWLHPARYRTEPCKDGTHCRRRICFFAHTPDQLRRVLPSDAAASSSTPGTGSPPVSPGGMLTESMRSLQLINNKMKMGLGTGLSMSPPSPSFWSFGVGSPRSPIGAPAFASLPSTPMRRSGGRITNISSSSSSPWEYSTIISSCCEEEEEEEEPVMERVESGRELRERIYEKLGKDNSLDRATGDQLNHRSASDADPDFGWVSELVA